MGAPLWLAALAGALLMGAGAQGQVQYCEEPCPPCGPCVQTSCPAIPACPASAPCTVVTNSNSNSNTDDGSQSGGIGLGSIKGEGPNSTDDTAAGGGTTQVCCSCSCHAPVCPNITCTAGPCNANGTVVTPASSSTGGGHRKELSNGQIGGIGGGILAAIAIVFMMCKYAMFFAKFFPRRRQEPVRRHRHRLRGTGTGATVTIDINVEPRSSAPASASGSATSSAPTSPATATATAEFPPSPIMYGVPSILAGPDQEQEQEDPGCVVM